MGIKIDVKKNVVPINFGGLEFEFPLDIESNKRFMNMEQQTKAKVESLKEEAKSLELGENATIETVELATQLMKQSLAMQYDYLLGEGSFEMIYEKFPDVSMLHNLLEELNDELAQEIENEQKRQEKNRKQRMEKYTKRKKK